MNAADLAYIDMNNWTMEGGNGNWQVQPGGRTVYQSINIYPASYFISSETGKTDFVLQGTITVDATQGDNDYIGFTMGYQDPSNNIVFAWDRGGMTPYSHGNNGYGKELWINQNGTRIIIAQDLGDASKGWVNGVSYTFKILYMSTRIKVEINGVTIFDVTGNFPVGKFGLFNESQGNVTYGFARTAPGSATEEPPPNN